MGEEAIPSPGMVPGFNHNVKHAGRDFHVQTEDSGAATPRIVTHLFAGGNILGTKRRDYGELLGVPDLPRVVRKLMQEQHKAMLRELLRGVHDEAAGLTRAPATAARPGQVSTPQLSSAPPAPAVAAAWSPAVAGRSGEPAPALRRSPPPLPPRPATLRETTSDPARAAPAAPAESMPSATEPGPPPLPRAAPASRPAPARAPVPEGGPPVLRRAPVEAFFGEDLVSDKTLDEVILSYLTGDTRGRKR